MSTSPLNIDDLTDEERDALIRAAQLAIEAIENEEA